MPRIRQQDIADALGVHVTTVSKALKNHPGVAEKTRALVLAEAEALGYRPDPMLHALAAYRRERAPSGYRATLAWFCNYPEDSDMRIHAGYDDYLLGAREAAAALGYRLDVIHNAGDLSRPAAVLRMLRARGIRGILLAPQAKPDVEIGADFSDFSVVTLGFTLVRPRFHLVTNDHFGTMLGILEKLEEMGIQHPGCYLNEMDNHRMGRRARAALESFGRGRRLPMLRYETASKRDFLRWLKQHPNLEAVITREPRVSRWLTEAGSSAQVIHYALDQPSGNCTGMYHNNRRIGAAAVDLLARLLERNETGIPEVPLRLMLESLWVESST